MALEWWQEVRRTLKLALPMILGFIGSMALLLIDGIMLGQLGVEPLAAYTLGSQIVSIFLVWGYGISAAQHILGAAAFARGKAEETGGVLQAGFFVLGVYSVFWGLSFQLFWPLWEQFFIRGFRQDAALVALGQGYMIFATWAILPMLWFANAKAFLEAQERPWIPLLVFIPGLPLNVLLNWLLIYGHWGFPELGVSGAGLATLLAKVVMLAALLTFVARAPRILRPRRVLLQLAGWARIRRFGGIGFATGTQSLLEHFMFVVMTLFMGQFGAAALAAHNITFRLGSFAFMIPLGVSFAVSIRVSQAYSRGDYAAIRRITSTAMQFTAILMLAAGGILVLLREPLAWMFYGERTEETIASVALAKNFILIMGAYLTFDGIQFVANGGLRGLSDVKVPTLLTLFCYWVVAVPTAWGLAFFTPLQGNGLWMGLLVGLMLSTLVLTTRLKRRLLKLA